MPVSVVFSSNADPQDCEAVRTAIEAVVTAPEDAWVVKVEAAESCLELTIYGPDRYCRTFRVFGENAWRHQPACLAALVKAEVNAYPVNYPADYAYAVAELALLGIPYDDARASEGCVVVHGVDMPVEHLASFYQRAILTREMLWRYTQGGRRSPIE